MATRRIGLGTGLAVVLAVALAPGMLAPVVIAEEPSPSATTSEPAATPDPTPSVTTTPPTAIPTTSPSIPPTSVPSATPAPTAAPTSAPAAVPTITPISGPAAPLVYSGARNRPVIALTIDDGYSAEATLAALRILQEQRVNATFFPIGRAVAANPAVWRQVAAAGFPIANHTWSHADLRNLTYAQIVADIRRFNQDVAAMTGRPVFPVVRPMGGYWNQTVLQAAAASGMRAVVMWETVFGDTGRGPGSQLVINATRGRNGSIILMHTNQMRSVEALPAVIDFYRSRGFTFVTVGQLLGIPGPVPFTSGPVPTATPAPTASPTATPSPTVTPTASPSRTVRPSPTVTATATAIPVPASSWIDRGGAALLISIGAVVIGGGALAWLLARRGNQRTPHRGSVHPLTR